MTLAEECISRGIAPSKRGLSRLLGRAPELRLGESRLQRRRPRASSPPPARRRGARRSDREGRAHAAGAMVVNVRDFGLRWLAKRQKLTRRCLDGSKHFPHAVDCVGWTRAALGDQVFEQRLAGARYWCEHNGIGMFTVHPLTTNGMLAGRVFEFEDETTAMYVQASAGCNAAPSPLNLRSLVTKTLARFRNRERLFSNATGLGWRLSLGLDEESMAGHSRGPYS